MAGLNVLSYVSLKSCTINLELKPLLYRASLKLYRYFHYFHQNIFSLLYVTLEDLWFCILIIHRVDIHDSQ